MNFYAEVVVDLGDASDLKITITIRTENEVLRKVLKIFHMVRKDNARHEATAHISVSCVTTAQVIVG